MRRSRFLIAPLLLALLAACGTPTDNTVAGRNNSQSSSAAASSSEAETTAQSPAASGSATGSQAAAGADPVDRNDKYSAAPDMTIDPNKTYTATIETTEGTIQAELYAKEAPMTVNNFAFLARDNFYQGIKFHRIISGFMVQTGDPTGTGTGGPGYEFEDEPVTREYTRGTIAMANAGPDTNGSQFFIVHQDSPLPKDYTIFGQVTEGLDVVDAIASTPTTGPEGSTPTEDVRITNITINEQ